MTLLSVRVVRLNVTKNTRWSQSCNSDWQVVVYYCRAYCKAVRGRGRRIVETLWYLMCEFDQPRLV
jgi:pyruvate formate-lyase activating enzyme-like uncharacterized protein